MRRLTAIAVLGLLLLYAGQASWRTLVSPAPSGSLSSTPDLPTQASSVPARAAHPSRLLTRRAAQAVVEPTVFEETAVADDPGLPPGFETFAHTGYDTIGLDATSYKAQCAIQARLEACGQAGMWRRRLDAAIATQAQSSQEPDEAQWSEWARWAQRHADAQAQCAGVMGPTPDNTVSLALSPAPATPSVSPLAAWLPEALPSVPVGPVYRFARHEQADFHPDPFVQPADCTKDPIGV